MLIRALIVLLIALNLGTAAWWMARPAGVVQPVVAQPQGVPQLQLLGEQVGAAPSAPPLAAAVEAIPPGVVDGPVPALEANVVPEAGTQAAAQPLCFALGPFADAATARTASAALAPSGATAAVREAAGTAASGYNVFLPASGDRDAALATAARVGAAGFDDYLVVNSGEMVNSVALGRYASRQRAQAHRDQLVAAGFPAQVQPVGAETPSQWWLDVRSVADLGATTARVRVGAAQARELDCSTLR